jgi:hypothetical protein
VTYIFHFGWTVEIKSAVDVSWCIFTMWCVASVYVYCFDCSLGERSLAVLCSLWQMVSRIQQLHWWFWQYFVVCPWYLTFYCCWCRWKSGCECLHLTNARIVFFGKFSNFCHVLGHCLLYPCSMPCFVIAHHNRVTPLCGRLWSWLNIKETVNDADVCNSNSSLYFI